MQPPAESQTNESLRDPAVWWSLNRAAVLPAQAPLPRNARAQIADGLRRLVEAPPPADDPLLPEALQAWAHFASTLSQERRAHARIVCEASLARVDIAPRERALIGLGLLGGDGTFATLADFALDTPRGRALDGRDGQPVPESVRAQALHALGLLAAASDDQELRQRIVGLLWSVCEGPVLAAPEVQQAAVLSMGVVPLEHRPGSLRAAAITSGPPTTRSEQLRYMLELLLDKGPARRRPLRAHAPRGLAQLLDGVPEWKPVVVDALLPYATRRGYHDVAELRRAAVLALGSLGDLDGDARDVSIRTALMSTTQTAEPVTRSYAVLSLGRIAGRPGHGPTRGFGRAQVRSLLLLQEARGKKTTKPWAALALESMEIGLQRTSPKGSSQSRKELLARSKLLQESAMSSSTWQDLLQIVQSIANPLNTRRSALEELNRRAGGGETPWNLCFGRDLNLLSCGPGLVGGRRPGLLLDLEAELPGNGFGKPEFSTMTCLK